MPPLEFHPLAAIFLLLKGKLFADLVEAIKQNGLRHRIVLYEGKVLDGRNRLRACIAAGVKPEFAELPEGPDPLAYVLDQNLHRRHLTDAQRGLVAAKIAQWRLGDNQYTRPIGLPRPKPQRC